MFHDQGLSWRAVRSSIWTLAGFGGGQVIRLIVNLVLARLLFPSAFGTMALVMVVLVGLNNFSDVGTRPAIMRSKRGDDPDFLNTAWTIEILRGIALCLVCAALAVPIARFYETPELASYLLVASFSAVLNGLSPTRALTAERHLSLRRLTQADLLAQLINSSIMIVLAWLTHSVWSLVIAMTLSSLVRNIILTWMLPGEPNRLRWEPEAVSELTHFGKWIFPSTVMGFAIAQGDKAILGKYLTLTQLGIYNIGYFLASFPLMLGGSIISRIMIPLYRESPPSAGSDEFRRIRRIRFGLISIALAGTFLVALLGPMLVNLLYDERYVQAGLVVTLVGNIVVPQIILMGYDQAALAAGDSRGAFVLNGVRAVFFLGCFWMGAHVGGLFGALVGQAVGTILSYPAYVWLARKHQAWDPLQDVVFVLAGLLGMAITILPRLDDMRALTTL